MTLQITDFDTIRSEVQILIKSRDQVQITRCITKCTGVLCCLDYVVLTCLISYRIYLKFECT